MLDPFKLTKEGFESFINNTTRSTVFYQKSPLFIQFFWQYRQQVNSFVKLAPCCLKTGIF
ncbi:hypothetical protein M23134_04850 [Microscilla marina ATCC 23134]|uniref:Uncharacterized protein n=1 Tax=Microscilla marina ATCC 23134 TaxID=313606 RepID=A1ZS12_MICM2|nr:hypothetical protein M23134_04850 [Microscilla marina ATCC 23134]